MTAYVCQVHGATVLSFVRRHLSPEAWRLATGPGRWLQLYPMVKPSWPLTNELSKQSQASLCADECARWWTPLHAMASRCRHSCQDQCYANAMEPRWSSPDVQLQSMMDSLAHCLCLGTSKGLTMPPQGEYIQSVCGQLVCPVGLHTYYDYFHYLCRLEYRRADFFHVNVHDGGTGDEVAWWPDTNSILKFSASATPPSSYWGRLAPVMASYKVGKFVASTTPPSAEANDAAYGLPQGWVKTQLCVRPLRPHNRSEAPKGEQWAVSCSNKPPPRSCREGWSPHFKFPGIRGGELSQIFKR